MLKKFVPLLVFFAHHSYSQALSQAQQQVRQGNSQTAQTQQQVDDLDDRLLDDVNTAGRLTRETDNLNIYNSQLEKLIARQKEEISGFEKRIAEIDSTHRAIVPLMLDMFDALKQFVALDLPFLIDERQNRLVELESMLADPGISVSEKFRRLLEAYQIESEYGKTIESYVGKVRLSEKSDKFIQARLLRVGRLSLMYQTLDGDNAFYWHQADKQWRPVSTSMYELNQAYAVAEKSRAPQLIKVPVASVTRSNP